MLNIINSLGLSNILVIVTRYFGGILLGTGGLVRAYSEATNVALENAEIVEKDLGKQASLEISYSDLQKIKYYFEQNNIKVINQEFGENIKIFFETTDEKIKTMLLNKENFNFKFYDFEIIKEKYIEV